MGKTDYRAIAKELLVQIRGKRPRSLVSKQLGYSHNQIHRWESQTRGLLWKDFLRLASLYQVDMKSILRGIFNYSGPIDDERKLLLHLGLQNHLSDFSKSMEIPRGTVSRWLSKKQPLRFHEMLKIIDLCTTEFPTFLSRLVDLDSLSSVSETVKLSLREQDVFYRFPGAPFVLSAIDLADYGRLRAHSDLFIAKRTGLSLKEAKETIAALIHAGALESVGSKFRTSRQQGNSYFFSRGIRKVLESLFKRHLLFAERSHPTPNSIVGFQVFSLNSSQYKRIRERYIQFYNEVCKIAHEGQESADRIYSMTLAIVDEEEARSPR